MDYKISKVESLQKNIRYCNYKVDKAQRETDRVMAEKGQVMAELAQVKRENREPLKRRLDRPESPAAKRHSPAPSPVRTIGYGEAL